jgi:hypothetical protein
MQNEVYHMQLALSDKIMKIVTNYALKVAYELYLSKKLQEEQMTSESQKVLLFPLECILTL